MNLDEIEKRAAAATPGPWKWKKDNLCAPAPYYVVLKPFYDDDTGEVTTCIFANDKDFIARARTDIPDLIAEVKRLQDENKRLTEMNERYWEREAKGC
jgi:hypothetical protein